MSKDYSEAEMARDLGAYAGRGPALAAATRELLASFSITFRHARFRFQGPEAPTVADFMEAAAQAFETNNGKDAWFCLVACIKIANQEGENRHYNPRLKQLLRGRHTAPMMVTEKSLKGTRFVPIYKDAEFVTTFYRCENYNNGCEFGDHFGIRTLRDRHPEAKACPFGCGGQISRHVITLEEQINGRH